MDRKFNSTQKVSNFFFPDKKEENKKYVMTVHYVRAVLIFTADLLTPLAECIFNALSFPSQLRLLNEHFREHVIAVLFFISATDIDVTYSNETPVCDKQLRLSNKESKKLFNLEDRNVSLIIGKLALNQFGEICVVL